MNEHKFFICKHCGNIVGIVNNAGVPLVCCGEKMHELVANTTEAAVEKHIPIVKVNADKIEVIIGEVLHPMVEEHYIQWVYLQTEHGGQRKSLLPNESPTVSFVVTDDKPITVFAYCNIHGLWKKDI